MPVYVTQRATPPVKEFGRRLLSVMKMMGIDALGPIADAADVEKAQVSRWLSDDPTKAQSPNWEQVVKLARNLGIPPRFLWPDDVQDDTGDLSVDEAHLVSLYRKVDPSLKPRVVNIMRELAMAGISEGKIEPQPVAAA